MKLRNYELKSQKIRSAFEALKRNHPGRFERRLNLSWSNWGLGLEPLRDSAKRLEKVGIRFIELHGNHYGPDLGYERQARCHALDRLVMVTAGYF